MATHGLLLTLGGAPEVPHRVTLPDFESKGDGFLPGEYHPSVPTPIDAVPGMTLERARKLDADESVPLKLVSLDKPKADPPAAQTVVAPPADPTTGESA